MKQMRELQPCGHPIACVVSSDEGTNHCGWCADVARLGEALEAVAKTKPRVDTQLRPTRCPQCRNTSYVGNMVCPTCQRQLFDCHTIVAKALSASADDWLAAHDAEVRREMQARCEELAKSFCHCPDAYTNRNLIDPTCDCHDIAAAIGEGEDERLP